MTAQARTLKLEAALAIRGWMTAASMRWLAERASEVRNLIEVGCFAGRSTRAMADNSEAAIHAVDAWDDTLPGLIRLPGRVPVKPGDGEIIYREFRHNLYDHIHHGRVLPMRAKSSDAAVAYMHACRGPFVDFVFIDGDHSRDAVRDDIELYAPLVRAGGILAGHDYNVRPHIGVKQAVDAAFPDGELKLGPDSIWWVRM